jgi:hypothetical protein
MGFLAIKGLFRKDSINDYQDVLVPLANAQRHPTVEAEYARRRSAEGQSKNDNTPGFATTKKEGPLHANETSGEEGVMRTSSQNYSPYTIEGLRAEVMEDVAASGHDSAYDCKLFLAPEGLVADSCIVKSKVINKAIQDIGMGRYNWELFILCGFGWFADK